MEAGVGVEPESSFDRMVRRKGGRRQGRSPKTEKDGRGKEEEEEEEKGRRNRQFCILESTSGSRERETLGNADGLGTQSKV